MDIIAERLDKLVEEGIVEKTEDERYFLNATFEEYLNEELKIDDDIERAIQKAKRKFKGYS